MGDGIAATASLERRKAGAATVSLAYNLIQALVKVAAAALTGSVSMLSEAVHSSTDVVASLMAYFGVKAAAAPPDEEHPYGHGKIESLAGFGESILLLLIVCYVVFEAIARLFRGGEVENLDLGLAVIALSVVSSLVVARHVLRVARESRSLALRSNGQHLMADFWTSIGVLVALGVTRVTGWTWVDSAVALVIAGWMACGAWRLAHEAFHHLIDRRLSDEEVERIIRILQSDSKVLGHHRLRTRLSGNMRYVDMHIVVRNDWSVVEAHELADDLEKRIAAELAPAQVVIHVDPYDPEKADREAPGGAP